VDLPDRLINRLRVRLCALALHRGNHCPVRHWQGILNTAPQQPTKKVPAQMQTMARVELKRATKSRWRTNWNTAGTGCSVKVRLASVGHTTAPALEWST